MGVKMFCAELNGELYPSYIDFRRGDVCYALAVNSEPGKPYDAGWAKARRDGWRVVPVEVRKIERKK